LERIDRILKYETPTREIIETLPNLLSLDARYAYFFRNLNSARWLKPLKDAGYFDAEKNPAPQEDLERPGTYRIPHWSVMDYLEKVATANGEKPSPEITGLLVQIIESIIKHRDAQGARIENFRTDWMLVRMISELPLDKVTNEHIEFIGTSLKSRWNTTLVVAEIGKSILPRLIDSNAKSHLIRLLDVMLSHRKIAMGTIPEYESIMGEYWFNDALDKHKQAIASLGGIEAAEIALNKMRSITDEDKSRFNIVLIPSIEYSSQGQRDRYEYQLVIFVRARALHPGLMQP
jgi:hypothetical protein